ncbi:type II toxin-antitoxin system RelE/ParE family toxin [Duganella levis]|uniref:type II toxin-antitoxin system RelE/ParE family toxin n=1 Tax=Duganella levis TaxID=2692169 RepID=UPI001E467E81|nr:type II toxin-antitoxin system RelE/ParE family toxin [Duganella levis]
MAQLVVLTTRVYIDHDRLIPSQGITQFYETGSLAGIQPHHAARLQYLLTALDSANQGEEMNESGFHLHLLSSTKIPRWSVKVNANWRLTFKFDQGNAVVIDHEDYH